MTKIPAAIFAAFAVSVAGLFATAVVADYYPDSPFIRLATFVLSIALMLGVFFYLQARARRKKQHSGLR